MRKSRFSETEIVCAVKQVEAGIPVGGVARKRRPWSGIRMSRKRLAFKSPRVGASIPYRAHASLDDSGCRHDSALLSLQYGASASFVPPLVVFENSRGVSRPAIEPD
jgi:hypothetical protein